ncbi:DNA-binding transcriptional regulator, MarR family [Variovorax sp. HW608]|uniref:MarR family winged helix-turn-helix transcriptional regulator n=1 Tax=Variovorax sp. HW608 TaxID=1034889 RepID=UPI00081FCC84|nr:MarR family transcriptional regulator [Variovorax sp. HW608]SCK23796.1 DNA-binding transcriptional regulator, MarR family [Variovorax sp. HW608]
MSAALADPATDTAHALAVELRMLASQLRRRLRQEASVADWTESQRAVLLRLERQDAATVTELAQAEGVRSQSMGATVASLMEAGWVKGAPDPADGRRTLLSITAQTRKVFRQVRAAREDWLQRTISARYSAAEQKQLAGAVRLLQRLLED